MFATRRIRSILLFVFASLLMTSLLCGCTSSNPFGSSTANQTAPVDMGTFSNKVGEFDDLEVPIDMEYQRDESMAIKTSSFEGGILAYKGRVELASLKQYMITALENKQWKLVGEAQSKSTLLAFTKPSKTCMVVLEEGFGGKYGYTKATLYVTVDLAASGRLNPFGEPMSN